MCGFCKNIMFFLLVRAIAIIPLIASSSLELDQGYHDDNNMRFLCNKKTLLVHCKSKDDDLGIHNIAAGTEYNWKFRPRVFGNTLFWCHLAYDNLHAAFDVYWENEALYYKCDYNDCFWIARDDGIYLKDIRNNRVEHRHPWKLG
ncbi:hypothetical protein ES288_A08G226800v1 [Gossypium darwinii]|uniref:S-protein homolog n=1 Tax=Gossypium darwinii TaxID=34276 RepID=A0A5D2FS13_GOSDA|nr:hypothetical protein ES288_A08G226800v1 [Gossypium darwinii]